MRTQHEEAREAVRGLDPPDETNSLKADIGSEWRRRVSKVERDLRLLQWMAGTSIVLAAIVLFRVITH